MKATTQYGKWLVANAVDAMAETADEGGNVEAALEKFCAEMMETPGTCAWLKAAATATFEEEYHPADREDDPPCG